MNRRVQTVLTMAAGTAICGGALAVAETSSDEQIHACMANRDGAVRIVADGAECNAKETAISWNARGPQGPAGADGVFGRQQIQAVSESNSDAQKSLAVMCPAGKLATGGGAGVSMPGWNNTPGGIGPVPSLTSSEPSYQSSNDSSGWSATATEGMSNYTGNWQLSIRVICVDKP